MRPFVDVIGTAGDGPSAADLIRATHPDLVFLDIQRPGLGGFEVARRLLEAQGLLNPAGSGQVRWQTTGDEQALRQAAAMGAKADRLGQRLAPAIEFPPLAHYTVHDALTDAVSAAEGGEEEVAGHGIEEGALGAFECRGQGGGIHNRNVATTVTNSTLSGNSANQGGGIFKNLAGTITLANTIVANSTATVAVRVRNRPSRVNRNAMMTVANTSKKPSTQRWTTHQRQYSASARWVRCPYMRPAA